MTAQKIQLQVVSQEEELLSTSVDQFTVTTSEGEITVLPKHNPLFSKLNEGVLSYRSDGKEHGVVLSRGFLNVTPNNEATIIVDSAIWARDISLEKAQEAVAAAQQTLRTTKDRRELLMAEASLKRAMLEIKITQKSKKANF